MPNMVCRSLVILGFVGSLVTTRAQPINPQELFENAIEHFLSGRIMESTLHFDKLVEIAPNSEAQLWQRGIALYYSGRYEDCRRQFESHRLVNPNDVENAAWHFLCVARSESPDQARQALLPVGTDPRVPMRQIYGLFSGSNSPTDVLTAASGNARSEFYAQLYLGLYAEALGNHEQALQHIRAAAVTEYSQVGGYMHSVAIVHLGLDKASQ